MTHPPLSPAPTSRFARKEPRSNDLREYAGESGAKLDDWLDELGAAVELFELNEVEAVRFGASRLRDAARLWWNALGVEGKAAINGVAVLGAAMRARFQPVTAARVAREELDKLAQGSRPINTYIADFQKLRVRLPSMAEEDALHAFERGLRRDIAVDLRKAQVTTVEAAIRLASNVGSISSSSAPTPLGRAADAHQMELDGIDGASLDVRIERAVLNALSLQTGGAQGIGAKTQTQTQRGYQQQREDGRRSTGKFGQGDRRPPMQPPQIPGVPDDVVQQRWADKQCLRCGSGDHRSMTCPNGVSSGSSSSSSKRGN